MYSNRGWTESPSGATRGCEWRQLDYKGRTSQPAFEGGGDGDLLFRLWGRFPGCVHTSELTTLRACSVCSFLYLSWASTDVGGRGELGTPLHPPHSLPEASTALQLVHTFCAAVSLYFYHTHTHTPINHFHIIFLTSTYFLH